MSRILFLKASIIGVVLGSCTGLATAEPAVGPPTEGPPMPIDQNVTVIDLTLTDTNETVGRCVQLYLWAKADTQAEWKLFAVDDTLLGADGLTADGHEAICSVGETSGPFVYNLPARGMVEGWYTACTTGCSEPFER